MSWIYERINECVVFCFVFYVKKSLAGIVLIFITYYSGLVRVSQAFWATDLYLQILFIMNLTHQFSAQPTRKDKTDPKINNIKSFKK